LRYTSLSVFDLDHTLVSKNCSFLYCVNLVRKGVFPASYLFFSIYYYMRHRFGVLSLKGLHEGIFEKLLKGISLVSLEKEADDFVAQLLSKTYYFPALERLKLAQHLGHYTVILSNSPSFLVSRVANLLRVDAWRATEYAVDKDDKLCHISALMQGEEKARCVQQIASVLQIGQESITAYSDSCLDFPFLVASGNAVAVNPDKALLQLAKERGWEVI
jgi:HAD superfamily hydrolase (TIGR01490 family)